MGKMYYFGGHDWSEGKTVDEEERRFIEYNSLQEDELIKTKTLWVLTNPNPSKESKEDDEGDGDDDGYEDYVLDEVKSQAERFNLEATATGNTRDTGHGREQEFKIIGDPDHIDSFEDAICEFLI